MKKNLWAFVVGGGMIAVAIWLGLRQETPAPSLQASHFSDPNAAASGGAGGVAQQVSGSAGAIVARDNPVVIGFLNDLHHKGTRHENHEVVPFVVGDELKFEAETQNATEYRWTVNGEVLKHQGQEWSPVLERAFELTRPGEYTVALQVRGADPSRVSQPKDVTLKVLPLYIESFQKNIVEEDDRGVTGQDFTVEVDMAEPVLADDEFYLFRYLINDLPVKHPEDGKEWTPENSLTYRFPAPGQYSFRVEVRRATEPQAEASAELEDVITVADSVITQFDVVPEKFAPLGTPIFLNAWTESGLGDRLASDRGVEVRFGYKRITDAEMIWLTEENGAEWGASMREWLATAPGTYLLRAEVREVGKTVADDAREAVFTVTDADY